MPAAKGHPTFAFATKARSCVKSVREVGAAANGNRSIPSRYRAPQRLFWGTITKHSGDREKGWPLAVPFLFSGCDSCMDRDFLVHLKTMAQERDLPVDELISEAEVALAAAYKKHVGATGEVTVRIDTEQAKLTAICEKEVVGVVTNHFFQMGIEEARKRSPGAEIGDFIPMEIPLEAFGRIAASTFKQVLQQKLREAERKRTLEEFEDRLYDVVTATVTRRDGRDVILTAGRSECVLPKKEQVP